MLGAEYARTNKKVIVCGTLVVLYIICTDHAWLNLDKKHQIQILSIIIKNTN